MRIKLDENLPTSLKTSLAGLGHDADTARDEGLSGRSDAVVWKAAQTTGRFLITMDLDFADLRAYPPGFHGGILIVRLPDSEQFRAAEYVTAWFQHADVESWAGCLVVGTTTRLRVRRPSPN